MRISLPPATPAVVIALFVLMAVLAPVVSPFSPHEVSPSRILIPPLWHSEGTMSHPLGTDYLGRDIWARLVHGARTSLLVALGALALGGVLGTVLGLLFNVHGLWDAITASRPYRVMRIVTIVTMALIALLAIITARTSQDLIIAIIIAIIIALELMNWSWYARVKRVNWVVLFALAIMAALGAGTINVIIALGVVTWTPYARVIRGEVMNIKTQDSIDRDRAGETGASDSRSNSRRLFPNAVNALTPLLVRQSGFLVLFDSSLTFLGVGSPPNVPSWGGMVSAASTYASAYWSYVFPLAAIILLAVSFIMLSNRLRFRGGGDTANQASG